MQNVSLVSTNHWRWKCSNIKRVSWGEFSGVLNVKVDLATHPKHE
uniref:Uncharacterized protein n=1 Tax=Anguilla anguilla TaxID=7936 RepID=A0A0E9TSX7_ANGAN